jgi:cysteine desulfuration protein SufE
MASLEEFSREFAELEDDEKLDALHELARELPPLSGEKGSVPFPESCRVQECQTAVHLWVAVRDDVLFIEADVPRKSPTVRGLVAVLVQSLNGLPVSQVLAFPEDPLIDLGLTEVLGMTRRQGVRGMIDHVKREVRGSFLASSQKFHVS